MKSLSDKIQTEGSAIWDNNFIYIEDLKKFIKELKKYIINNTSNRNKILGLECEVVNKKELLNFIKLMVGNELI